MSKVEIDFETRPDGSVWGQVRHTIDADPLGERAQAFLDSLREAHMGQTTMTIKAGDKTYRDVLIVSFQTQALP